MPLVWLLLLLFNDVTKIVDKSSILNKLEISKNKEQEPTIKLIITFEYWISNCLMLFNIVYVLKHTRTLPDIVSMLYTVEKHISRYFDPARLRQIHRQEGVLTQSLVLLCLLVTLSPIAVSYAHRIGNSPIETKDFGHILIKDLSKFIIFSVELQFSTLCIYIYNRMALINTLFSQNFLQNERTKQIIGFPPYGSIPHRRFQGQSFEQRALVDKFRILTLTKQNHEVMFRLAEQLRRSYQFQLMCSIGEIFFNIINHVYVTVKMFRPGEMSYWSSVVNVMWAVQETARVVVLSLAAGTTADEMAVGIVNSLMLCLQYKYSDKQSLSSNAA